MPFDQAILDLLKRWERNQELQIETDKMLEQIRALGTKNPHSQP